MDSAFRQILDLFRCLSVMARLQVALLLAVIVVSVFAMFVQPHDAEMEFLFRGYEFRDQELIHVEAALCKAGLGEYEIHGSRVLVPKSQRVEYVTAIADGGALPVGFGGYISKAVASNETAWPF